ncbi:ankyrin repeat-containing protein ITN1-like [Corylus avellana]|uniref:ankyrin repeat-containing protein ITN1-like n=1 Tax=Corylus avellana TaxID=13451 RepID=UPI001E23E6B5|nr:ankyrin repeat-containing protein ITN1-like [Corylus avellana]
MDRGHDEKANMHALYEASRDGCVSTLTTLIQRDALILDRVLLTSFGETPLHIAALLGHFEFSKALLSKKPKLAEEVDSLGRIPLHLASAEGHTEIVRALLLVNADVCVIFRDRDERIPLHLAAMRGRIETMRLLIHAQPTSILENLHGDSVLHLCVQNNHLEALELLVASANGDQSFLSSKDRDGNSILHLAVMLKQMKVINYLLSVPEIKREANSKNKYGQTALDVLDVLEASNVYPRDFKYAEIKNILKEAGVKRSIDDQSWVKRGWRCICSSLGRRLKHQGNWIDETRGTLMVVATVMATMAFQVGINPPGGVWQDDAKGKPSREEDICYAGTAILSCSLPEVYQLMLKFNTTSFIASVCVVLLVISGFPLTSKFSVWLLSLTMTTSVVFMTLTYLFALDLITSFDVLDNINKFADNVTKVWIGVVVITGVIQIIRPLYWMVNKLRNFKRKSTKAPAKVPANV